jgi:hypothetical protein
MKGVSSNKGWHQKWFYLRNHDDVPLPNFTGRWYKDMPEKWMYGPPTAKDEEDPISPPGRAVLGKRRRDGRWSYHSYHDQRVLPLMRREQRLFDMVPGASLEGTVLVVAPLDRAEVKKRVKSALWIMITDAELNIHPLWVLTTTSLTW